MGGFAVAASPSSPPPNTVYFGYVPDRFNVLQRAHLATSVGFIGDSSANGASPANLISNWQIYNPNQIAGTPNVNTCSFGANTSAPDGTNNGMKVIEATNNGIHEIQTIFFTNRARLGGFKLRVSVFAKAAERTRFALYVGDGSGDPNNIFPPSNMSGCKTVFDVGNGQIGVANQSFFFITNPSPPYAAGPTEIVAFGNGWYRCTMDVLMGGCPDNGLAICIMVDSGSGTGTENTNYTGDGTSGLYFWRSTCLPPAAWSLNSITYFEDFTSLAKFDLGETNAPGFDWYLDYNWSGFGNSTLPPAFTDPASLSIVNGTLLKIAISSTNLPDLAIQSAAPLHDGSGNFNLGRLFRPPALLEVSCSWDGGIPPNQNGPTFWTRDIASLAAPHLSAVSVGCEFDFFELVAGGRQIFGGTVWLGAPFINYADLPAKSGTPVWYSTYTYDQFEQVSFNGVIYQATGAQPNLNQEPDLDVAHTYWTIVSSTLMAPIDYTQQHVLSTLWLPASGGDMSQIILFYDGRFCGAASHNTYAANVPPVLNNVPNQTIIDKLQYPYLFGTSINQNCYVDFIRTTQ